MIPRHPDAQHNRREKNDSEKERFGEKTYAM
jgi:hypothetical protein